MSKELTDILRVEGIMSKGYGLVPKLVMQDRRLSRDAKAIYSYMCSYAGSGKIAFPGVEKICYDLNFGKSDTMVKHRRQLERYGYIKVEQKRKKDGTFDKNIYTLIQFPVEKGETTENIDNPRKLPNPSLGDSVKKQEIADPLFEGHRKKGSPSKRGSNNNSIYNNNSKDNNNNNMLSKQETNNNQKTDSETEKDVVVNLTQNQKSTLKNKSEEVGCDSILVVNLAEKHGFEYVYQKLVLVKNSKVNNNVNGFFRRAVEENWEHTKKKVEKYHNINTLNDLDLVSSKRRKYKLSDLVMNYGN